MECIPHLDDEHDPYSATIVGINKSLAFGFKHSGAMSEAEYETLKKLEDLLRTLDPSMVPQGR